jgi:hyperosmotically inducible protein
LLALVIAAGVDTAAVAGASQSRAQELLENEIRKQFLKLPYVGAFDWLEAEVNAEKGTVVLRGQVVRPSSSKDAERRIKKLEGVESVVNEIEVLPPSSSDSRIRRAVFREIFSSNSPLFRYANNPNPPIRIIVRNGYVTLKGVVSSDLEKQVAYARASVVPGIFGVKNELVVQR